MTYSTLIKRFDERTELPVHVEEVAEALKALHVCREFYFWAADIDPSKVRGFVQVWNAPFDDSGHDVLRFADIYYSKRDPSDWQRFVTCKELIHCMDSPHFSVATIEKLKDLMEKVALPPELQDPFTDGPEANIDHVGPFIATAIMFPMACRNLLLPKYKSGKVTLEQIAEQADIPVKYIRLAMSDTWVKGVYPAIISIGEPERRS